MIDNGLSDIIQELKRYNFDIRELNPEDTTSGRAGFVAVKNGVTVHYDGDLYINNEPVRTPWGDFDINIADHVQWFNSNQDAIVDAIARENQNRHRGSIVGAK